METTVLSLKSLHILQGSKWWSSYQATRRWRSRYYHSSRWQPHLLKSWSQSSSLEAKEKRKSRKNWPSRIVRIENDYIHELHRYVWINCQRWMKFQTILGLPCDEENEWLLPLYDLYWIFEPHPNLCNACTNSRGERCRWGDRTCSHQYRERSRRNEVGNELQWYVLINRISIRG